MEEKNIIETNESNFKKNMNIIAVALILLIFDYKIGFIPITKAAACVLLFIAGKYFNKNYKNKNIYIAAIFVTISVGLGVLKEVLNPMLYIGKLDEIKDIISQYVGNISNLPSAEVNPNQNELLNKVFDLLKAIKNPVFIDTIISSFCTILSILGFYFVGKCMVKLSNSEEACEKISKASKFILIFGVITTIFTIIEIIATMGLISNINISTEGSSLIGNMSGILGSVIFIVIISLVLCVSSIIYLVNQITFIIQVFKTAKAGKDNNPLMEQTTTSSNNEKN